MGTEVSELKSAIIQIRISERSGISLVLKKILKAVTTLALLAGCYFGYVHVFAIVVEQLRAISRNDNFVVRGPRLEFQAGIDRVMPRAHLGTITGAPILS